VAREDPACILCQLERGLVARCQELREELITAETPSTRDAALQALIEVDADIASLGGGVTEAALRKRRSDGPV
jgi:hypothetical protein